jgi:peroxiredoxin family protein
VPTDPPRAQERLGVLLIAGTHERAHYAFILATGAAAVGRAVVLFATNGGCHALLADWSGLEGAAREAEVTARGVAGLAALREAAAELGVRMVACEAGLRMAGLEHAALAEGVEVAGVATFLEATRGGQLIAL